MVTAIIVSAVTGVLVCASVLFKPEIKIFGKGIGTYWIVSLVGAVAILVSGVVPVQFVASAFSSAGAVNPIKILALFFSMTFISVYLDELGVFEFLANEVLKKCGNSQKAIFLKLYLLVSVLTVFTSNDVIILTFTPFICSFSKHAKINPLPYLFAEFIAGNTWSMCLIIGNPTNVYLGSSANLAFWDYFEVMALPTLFSGVVTLCLLLLIFRKSLKEIPSVLPCENIVLKKIPVAVGTAHLVVCVILLAISSYIGLEMWLVSVILCLSLAIFSFIYSATEKSAEVPVRTLRRLPYELIPFAVSMFVLVSALSYTGVAEKIASVLSGTNTVFSVGISSFFVANVINNIPMSVLFSSVLASPSFCGSAFYGGVYSAIIGSNLGAYFTPVGALAGIMWISMLKKSGVKLSFKNFVGYGAIISAPTLLTALVTLNFIV